jgi:hypothetical protein
MESFAQSETTSVLRSQTNKSFKFTVEERKLENINDIDMDKNMSFLIKSSKSDMLSDSPESDSSVSGKSQSSSSSSSSSDPSHYIPVATKAEQAAVHQFSFSKTPKVSNIDPSLVENEDFNDNFRMDRSNSIKRRLSNNRRELNTKLDKELSSTGVG